jgi:hypothetical protein
MTEPGFSPVEALRERLGAAEQAVVAALQAAQESADRLIRAPSVELVQERDQRRAEAEVASLEIERIKRQLREAEERAREDGINELLARRASAVQQEAGESERRARAHLSGLEAELAEINGQRDRMRGVARELLALGYSDFPPQLGIREDGEFVKRLDALSTQYRAALKMIGSMRRVG